MRKHQGGRRKQANKPPVNSQTLDFANLPGFHVQTTIINVGNPTINLPVGDGLEPPFLMTVGISLTSVSMLLASRPLPKLNPYRVVSQFVGQVGL